MAQGSEIRTAGIHTSAKAITTSIQNATRLNCILAPRKFTKSQQSTVPMRALLGCGWRSCGQDTVNGVISKPPERLPVGIAGHSLLRRANCSNVGCACFL